MNYKQFRTSLYATVTGSDVVNQTSCFGKTICETADGEIFVDGARTEHSSLEEASDSIRHERLQEDIQREIQQELYEEMSDNKIADIIKTHHENIRITDTLIESYVELASSKLFTTDKVAQDIRKLNKLDRVVENRVDFKLEDGTVVVITEETQNKINKIFGHHSDVVAYMRQSIDNFLDVVNQLEE